MATDQHEGAMKPSFSRFLSALCFVVYLALDPPSQLLVSQGCAGPDHTNNPS